MNHVLSLFQGRDFLGSRAGAQRFRIDIETILESDRENVVILDFSGITGLSHGFTDELLSPLSEQWGEDLRMRVIIEHCSAIVLDDLRSVAEMHGLSMPGVEVDRPFAA